MRNKIFYLLAISTILFSCSRQSSEYAKVSGLIANNGAKEILILGKGYKKVIPVNLDGTFSDTLKLQNDGFHTFYDGKTKQPIYLKNGNAINFNYNYKTKSADMHIGGIGFETTQFLIDKSHFESKEKINNFNSFYKLNKEVFNTRISYLESEVQKLLSNPKIEKVVKDKEVTNYKNVFSRIKRNYQSQHLLTSALGKGKPSPKFSNYLNYKGGKTSLDDFKGKYVYIDIWATWCGPCKQQIPYMKKIEEEYHNKNIKFISISVDDGRRYGGSWDDAKDKWRTMIKDKKMGGIQLFADRAFQSEFIKAYGIRSIPRFLLIDPNGNIVDSKAPRPSQKAIKDLLNSLSL